MSRQRFGVHRCRAYATPFHALQSRLNGPAGYFPKRFLSHFMVCCDPDAVHLSERFSKALSVPPPVSPRVSHAIMTLQESYAAYSTMVVFKNGDLGVLYEDGSNSPDGGYDIVFLRVPRKLIKESIKEATGNMRLSQK